MKSKCTLIYLLLFVSAFIMSMKPSSGVDNLTASLNKQKTISISFVPLFKNENLIFNDKIYSNELKQRFSFETLKFYISKIKFLKKDKVVFAEPNSFHLIDADYIKSMSLKIQIPNSLKFDEIQLGLGLDSAANVGEMIGDLDPTKGMYWTWKAGYINFKLEGYRDGINSRNHEFQFHLGGYMPDENCFQEINLSVPNIKNASIKIGVDIFDFIQHLDLDQQNHIMSPGSVAVLLSNQLSKSFKLIQK